MSLSSTITQFLRSCRRRCMGCDPCWICRRSYPSSVSITAIGGGSSGSSGSGGSSITGWVGCCGGAAGTFVPAIPYGQRDIDNGITIHDTFKHLPDGLGVGPSCSANWRWKKSLFYQGMARTNPGGSPPAYGPWLWGSAVSRCNGDDTDYYFAGILNSSLPPGAANNASTFEMLVDLRVSVSVGSISGANVAANPNSTRVDVSIFESYFGYAYVPPVVVGSGTSVTYTNIWGEAYYTYTKQQRYSVWLPKPCPESGSFSVPHFGTTVLANTVAQGFYNGFVWPTAGPLVPVQIPSCVTQAAGYSVSITI